LILSADGLHKLWWQPAWLAASRRGDPTRPPVGPARTSCESLVWVAWIWSEKRASPHFSPHPCCERQLHVISGRTRTSILDIVSTMPASLGTTGGLIW